MNNKKEKIIERYNSTAHIYDKRYSNIQAEKFKHLLNNFTLEGKKILDIGCGTGLFQEYIQNNLKFNKKTPFSFVVTDISLNMLTLFLEKKKKGLFQFGEKINIVLSDMGRLPFRNDVFNSIFSLTSLQNLPNINEGIEESLRVSINHAELRFSILKKSLDVDNLNSLLKPHANDLIVFDKKYLEDIIISFNLDKKS